MNRSTPGDLLRRARFEVRTLLGVSPTLFLPLARLEWRLRGAPGALSPRPFLPDTGLAIEGFPRSGNTFAVAAFLHSQAQPPEVAHHFHAPAQIVAAVRAGVPALCLVREPRDAVISLAIRNPSISLGQGMRTWRRFYEALLPYRGKFVAADFSDVIADFGMVIGRVNALFGTRFAEFEHSEENVRRCFERIEERNRRLFGGGRVSETSVARPSRQREQLKLRLRDRFTERRLASLLAGCEELRSRLLEEPAPMAVR